MELGQSRKSVLELFSQLKLQPAASGVSQGSLCQWVRYDYPVGSMKCSFNDGQRGRKKDEAVRYSQALSNKTEVSLLLVFTQAADTLAKAVFLTSDEVKRLAQVDDEAEVVCAPCRDGACPKRLLYSSAGPRREAIAREAEYDVVFGREACLRVHHEYRVDSLNIDVCVYGPDPSRGRGFYTMVTSGLSGRSMLAKKESAAGLRAEVVLYAEEPRDLYVSWLRHICRLSSGAEPVILGHGLTMVCPPGLQAPLASGAAIEGFMTINAAASPENKISERLKIGGDPVKLMVVVPLTLLEKSRAAELVEKLSKVTTPVVFRESRPTYVS